MQIYCVKVAINRQLIQFVEWGILMLGERTNDVLFCSKKPKFAKVMEAASSHQVGAFVH